MMRAQRPGAIRVADGMGVEQSRSYGVSWWLSGGIAAANCIAAYQPKGAASYAASKVNLANPGTYDAYEGIAPDWSTAAGWDFGAITKYLKTNLYPDQDWSGLALYSSCTTLNGYICGAFFADGTRRLNLLPNTNIAPGGVFYGSGKTPSYYVVAPTLIGGGVLGIAGLQGYRNGLPEGANPSAPNTGTSRELYIGCLNQNLVPSAQGDAIVGALAVYDITLSNAQMAAVSAAMAAL